MDLKVECNVNNLFENLSSKVPFWNVGLPESLWDLDDDAEEEFDVLCELVRNQYLKRLRQTLLDNLDVAKGYQKQHLNKIDQCVDVCMAEMEKRALRQCMMASIYREAMSKMINKVKICTNNSMLYDLLQQTIESNDQTSNAYNIKAENMSINTTSVGINTVLKLNKDVSTQTKKLDTDDSASINSYANNVNVVNLNTFKILYSSCDIESKISEPNVFENLNSLLKSPSCISNAYEELSTEINKCYYDVFSNLKKNSVNNNTTSDSINALLKDLQDSPENEQIQSSSKLEERLITLGLETGPSENLSKSPESNCLSPNTIRPNKIKEILMNKFKSERVAKKYEFQRSMNSKSKKLQIKLNHRFTYLFGEDHTSESDPLSIEEEHIIAHKRVVKMVVEFMTPYYKARRINRHMFKTLAKLISKHLMDRSYDPDAKTVAQGVNEFFTENRCIKTMEDIYQ